MPEIHFGALDLNLLRVFQALLEERSVTRAGRRLGLSQSAVSHALNRLRHVLGDELFVRGPDGMRPTLRSQEIGPQLNEGLRQLQQALVSTKFDPARTLRQFTISVSAYSAAILMPPLIGAIRQAAPGAEVRLKRPGPSLGEDLLTGRVDLAIGSFGRSTPGFDRQTLFSETMVWAFRADHPAARSGVLTLEALAATPHVVIVSGEDSEAVDGRVNEGGLERRVIWDDRETIDEVLARAGLRRKIGLAMPDPHGALAVVGLCDMAVLAPRRLLTAFAEHYQLKSLEPPYRAPPIPIEALWRRETGDSPPMAWLRGVIRAVAADL